MRARLRDELGLDPAPELRALEQQVLRQEIAVPTPRATPAPRLPVSSFVGRAADLDAAAELPDRHRVVTLCGPGGVGRTRLAAHIAAELACRYDDGVLLVEFGDGGSADVEPALAVLVEAITMHASGVGDGSRKRASTRCFVLFRAGLWGRVEQVHQGRGSGKG